MPGKVCRDQGKEGLPATTVPMGAEEPTSRARQRASALEGPGRLGIPCGSPC
jgi:hypothetical protein